MYTVGMSFFTKGNFTNSILPPGINEPFGSHTTISFLTGLNTKPTTCREYYAVSYRVIFISSSVNSEPSKI
jgi:hypothetical protein